MKNWKTTLFGILGAVSVALSGAFPDLKELFLALAGLFGAIFALVAKDHDVTGV